MRLAVPGAYELASVEPVSCDMCKEIQGAAFSLLPDVKRFRQLPEHGPDDERRLAGDDVLDVERRALAVPVGEGSHSLDFVLGSSARLILGASARAP